MSDGMIPRIAVPDEDDRATIVAALIHYSHTLTGRAEECGYHFAHLVAEMKITADLLTDLVEQTRNEAITAAFDASDEEMAEHLKKLRQEFGNDTPD